jgi:NOL1/NOP2/sun family putative RNA methylase
MDKLHNRLNSLEKVSSEGVCNLKEVINRLPVAFVQRMEKLLSEEEFQAFLNSYNDPRYYGLRVNDLKISVEEFLAISPFELEPVPWTKNGFYYQEGERPAKHPYYHAGFYYIQEPSAMAPGALIQAQPGDKVLDLCAAPGGKSTQVAADLRGEGVLVANDSSGERVKALARNLDLFGVRNSIVTNETPDKLAKNFPNYFDKILIDAPCSGEGMFRKDDEAAKSWGVHSVEVCVLKQREILDDTVKMLKPGGTIIYSTCTFAPEEDEGMIEEFLTKYPEFSLLDLPVEHGFVTGQPDWTNGRTELTKTVRLWPHKLKGEGHFVAWLRKDSEVNAEVQDNPIREENISRKRKGNPHHQKVTVDINLEDFKNFITDSLNFTPKGKLVTYGEHLYLSPEEVPDLGGLKVIRPGSYLGVFKKNRFEPSHALALALKPDEIIRKVTLKADDPQVIKYLKGETLNIDGPKGWTVVCIDEFPLGWAKQTDGILKNYYPKGWRWMD